MRERLINRRRQGDLGEASAIEWLTRQGATVSAPLGHSPDYDLIAEFDGRLIRVQVKTSTFRATTPNGYERWSVGVATNGGNQSWTGTTKRFDPGKVDALYVLVGDGRRWMIPASAVEGHNALALAGPKYSEFEIEPGPPLSPLVYGSSGAPLESTAPQGVYPSGQRMAAVNRPAKSFAGSNPAAPMNRIDRPKFERRRARSGQTILGAKRRLGIPVGPCEAAGLAIGDRMRIRADGPGRIVLERIEPPPG